MSYPIEKDAMQTLCKYLKYLVISLLFGIWAYFFKTLVPLFSFVLNVMTPLFIGLIIAYLLNPFVGLLCKKNHRSRTVNTLLIYSGFILVLLTGAAIIVPRLVIEIYDFSDSIPAIATKTKEIAQQVLHHDRFGQFLNQVLDKKDEIINVVDMSVVTDFMTRFFKSGVGIVAFFGKLSNALFIMGTSIVLGMMIGFYFLKDIDHLWELIRILIPNKYEVKTLDLMKKIDVSLYGFMRGQIIICFIVGLITFIGLSLMGVKYALLIGVIAGCSNVIPYLGPVIGAAPAMIQIILRDYPDMGDIAMGLLLIFLLSSFIQALDGFFLSPKIVGDKSDLHPIIIMIALVVGGKFGIGGMIVAVPVAIIIKVVLYELWYYPAKAEQYKFEKELEGR